MLTDEKITHLRWLVQQAKQSMPFAHPDGHGGVAVEPPSCYVLADDLAEVLDALNRAERSVEEARGGWARAIEAHRNLHGTYGNTSACGGGIGGAMLTQHCGVTCYSPGHLGDQAVWQQNEADYFAMRGRLGRACEGRGVNVCVAEGCDGKACTA